MTRFLETPRLILRRWKAEDVEPFATLNSDPEVMEFFPKTSDLAQTIAIIDNIETGFNENDYGLWAVEIKDTNEFIGMVGLCKPQFEAHFTPCVEVGWRLGKQHWGHGYATEAAEEAMRDGFEQVGLAEIVSMTAVLNKRSMRVMEKLKMKRDPADDFDHPMIDDGHPLKPHLLYKLSESDWRHHIR